MGFDPRSGQNNVLFHLFSKENINAPVLLYYLFYLISRNHFMGEKAKRLWRGKEEASEDGEPDMYPL
jgi:hypothetical protein